MPRTTTPASNRDASLRRNHTRRSKCDRRQSHRSPHARHERSASTRQRRRPVAGRRVQRCVRRDSRRRPRGTARGGSPETSLKRSMPRIRTSHRSPIYKTIGRYLRRRRARRGRRVFVGRRDKGAGCVSLRRGSRIRAVPSCRRKRSVSISHLATRRQRHATTSATVGGRRCRGR